MLLVELNPRDAAEQHLSGLQRCFAGWGDQENFRWAFDRRVDGPNADVLLVESDGGVVAGSAVTYRQLRLASGSTVLAGIMTGSWTLPEARGMGCFTRIIEESRAVAAERGAGLLLAFVTGTNPSGRRLRAAGAGDFPTWYCSAEPTPAAPRGVWASAVVEPVVPVALPALVRRAAVGHTAVTYGTNAAWAMQFVGRPGGGEVLRLDDDGNDGFAVVEHSSSSDRLHLLLVADRTARRRALRTLGAAAAADGRQLFCFTSSQDVADDSAAVGMTVQRGSLMALRAEAAVLARAMGVEARRPDGGDADLADPSSPWYLGPWAVHGGDRM